MITVKVKLNNNFDEAARNSDGNLQEIILFEKVDKSHAKIISLMVGFGTGKEWEKIYDFFTKGNEWTYNELINSLK